MRRLVTGGGILAAVLTFFLVLGGASAPAQAQPAPPGSYLNTCREVRVRDGRDLTALCETRNRGTFNATRLEDFFQCRGDIANLDGRLWCERRAGPPPGPRPGPPPMPPPGTGNGPPGSYRATCTRIDQRGGALTAFCLTRRGEWVPARLDLFGCQRQGDIRNDNGVLVCRPHPVPRGSYLQTCRNPRVAGAWLAAECRDMSGRWRDARLNLFECGPNPNVVNFNGALVCR